MPHDIVAMLTTTDWDRLVRAVEAARGTNQSAEDTWCVVGVNGAHILTVWSQPHTAEDKFVRPSRHAEERLVTLYADQFNAGFKAMTRTSNIVTVFLKKSPCNFGTGSCYDMFRRFLLEYRSDHSKTNQVVVVYDKIYSGPNGMYSDTSEEAMEEFKKIPNCKAMRAGQWYTRDYPVLKAAASGPSNQDKPSGNAHSGPKPVQLPSRKAEEEAGIKRVEPTYTVLGSTKQTAPSEDDWATEGGWQ